MDREIQIRNGCTWIAQCRCVVVMKSRVGGRWGGGLLTGSWTADGTWKGGGGWRDPSGEAGVLQRVTQKAHRSIRSARETVKWARGVDGFIVETALAC